MSAEVSHGRGGAGNIAKDDTQYTDGEVTRTGPVGSHHDGAFSTGRGGAANIGDAGAAAAERKDQVVVPPEATRPESDKADYHVGRGGAGNEHLAPGHDKHKHNAHNTGTGGAVHGTNPDGTAAVEKVSFADKIKNRLSGLFGSKK